MPTQELDVPWYVWRNGQKFGPMMRRDVEEMYVAGRIAADDQLWSAGLEHWTPASAVLGPGGVAPPPPPAPPSQPDIADVEPAASPGSPATGAAKAMNPAHKNLLFLGGVLAALAALVLLPQEVKEDTPSESLAREVFAQHGKRVGYNVLSFSKTDGARKNVLGSDIYEMRYEALIEYPNGLNLQCKRPPPGMMVPCMAITWRDRGARATDRGTVVFEKSEKGWRPRLGI